MSWHLLTLQFICFRAPGLKSRLINSATLDDIERFIDEVNQYDLEYCGRESIDCDTTDNIELLKFSVRQRLFSNPEILLTLGRVEHQPENNSTI